MKIAARILTSISLAVIGVLVALLLAEGYFRLFTPDDIAYFLEWRSKARQITRVREEERGTGLYRPNASVTIWGITYAINSDGFRDDDRYSRKKPPDTFRIMAVGDSYTFGAGVELEDTYSKKLEKLLNERHPSPLYRYYEVINAGIPGANTAMEVDFLREWGLKYNPDLVLVAFVLNDLEAPYGSKRPLCIPTVPGIQQWLSGNSYLYLFLENRCRTVFYPDDATPEWQLDETTRKWRFDESSQEWWYWARVVEYNGQVARETGLKVLVAIFPEQTKLNDYPYTVAHEQIKAAYEQAGLPVVDMLPGYQSYGIDSFAVLPFDAHPNPASYQIAAEIMYDALIAKGLIPGAGQ
jgi:lysophospholipase L1-like esterase